MTERTTYDPTASRQQSSGERSSSQAGSLGSAGASGSGREGSDESDRERARRAAEEIKTAARDAASSTADAVKNRVSGELDYRKYKGRQRLSRMATALRDAGTKANGDDEMVGRYMEQAADRVDHLAQYLDQRNVDEILRDARQMARRRPELFAGSLFVAGLMLGRFLRSSTSNGGHDEPGERRAGGSTPYRDPSTPSTTMPSGGFTP